jgi:hypothetical protein
VRRLANSLALAALVAAPASCGDNFLGQAPPFADAAADAPGAVDSVAADAGTGDVGSLPDGGVCSGVDASALHVSLAAFCATATCPANEAQYRRMFTNCDQSGWSYACRVQRLVGCDKVSYFWDYDESGGSLYTFDAATGALLGVTNSTDTPVFCGAFTQYAGQPEEPPYSPAACPVVDRTYCCF